MTPDASVLLLTTLIGAGQALFLALFTVQAYALFGLLPPQHGHTFYAHGSLVALVAIPLTAGSIQVAMDQLLASKAQPVAEAWASQDSA